MFGRMLNRNRSERKTLERFLSQQLDEAILDYDSRLPHGIKHLFMRSPPSSSKLDLHPYVIKGFRHALGGAVRALVPHNIIYDVAASTVLDIFEDYFEKAPESAKANDSSAILSFRLVKNDNIPLQVKDEVGRMRHRIRVAIFASAAYIEMHQFISLAEALDSEASSVTTQRTEEFLNAQYKMRVSCKSIAVSIELFRLTIQKLAEKIKHAREKDVRTERRCVLLSAVFVYEILDLMVCFIKAFQIQGIDELRELHAQMNSEIEVGNRKNEEIYKRVKTIIDRGEHTEELRESIIGVEQRRKSLEELGKIWHDLMERVAIIENGASGVHERLEILEIKRDEAAENIRIMAISEVTAMLGDNVRAVEGVLTMKLPDLPPITMDDVRRYVPSGFADSDPLRGYDTQFAVTRSQQ